MKKGVQIFISYRRETGREIARNLFDHLSLAGYNTFFDYDSMRDGEFNKQIFSAIEQADDFILVLSKNALSRCADNDDWVRLEIEYAISLKKHIVLLATDDFEGFENTLPSSIKNLKFLQFHAIDHRFYEESMNKLKNDLYAKPHLNNLKKILIVCLIGMVGMTLFLLFFYIFRRPYIIHSYAPTNSKIKVHISLMRYREINRLSNSILFPDSVMDRLYLDSISDDGKMIIYPDSTMQFHASNNPLWTYIPIILQLYNGSNQTVVLPDGSLEIDSIMYLDTIKMPNDGNLSFSYNIVKINNKHDAIYPLPEFSRNIVQGESDNEYFFFVTATHPIEARVRFVAQTTTGQFVFSNYLYLRYPKM